MTDWYFTPHRGLTGGVDGYLDEADGSQLKDNDGAFVIDSSRNFRAYVLDEDSGVAESSPETIAPDTAPGAKRWRHCFWWSDYLKFVHNLQVSTTRTLTERLCETVSVKDFGALGNGTADDTVAIQAAIDALNGTDDTNVKGGKVYLPKGRYVISVPLTLYRDIWLVGESSGATELYLADGSDCDMIKSDGFDALTGTNTWLAIPSGLGLFDIRLNGNKANNASGRGVAWYCKRPYVDRVIIHDTKGIGWYSEAGSTTGQSEWGDLPEGEIGALHIRNCGDASYGMHYKGPHDCRIRNIVVNGGDAVKGLYISDAGSCDINFAHVYNCAGVGIHINDVRVRAEALTGESCDSYGVQLEGSTDSCCIGNIYAYNNNRVSETCQVLIDSGRNQIQNIYTRTHAAGCGGVRITDTNNTIANLFLDGATTATGIGLEIDNAYNSIGGGVIYGFAGVGGIGYQHTSGAQANVNLVINNCETGFKYVAGTNGQLTLTINLEAGQTMIDGSGLRANGTELRLSGDVDGTKFSSYTSQKQPITITSGSGIKTQTHNLDPVLPYAPELEDCTTQIIHTGNNGNFVMTPPWIVSATNNQIVTRFYLTTADNTLTGNQYLAVTARI